ncbi:DUF2634 domain-containing protein [Paenibacillus terreus]|uniref:DUF2634 domain-containing protein n=1 Tax=Paenibacillus terreus TaxID=1387834 RepID=A0ABV5B177_9BACL
MIPQGGQLTADANEEEFEVSLQEGPSLTYRLDWNTNRIAGRIDELEAVKQAVLKILLTERYEHLIYSFDYGTEWTNILGKDRLWVQSELNRVITEALMQDDRVEDVVNFRLSWQGNDAIARFTVVSSFGDFSMSKEVSANV